MDSNNINFIQLNNLVSSIFPPDPKKQKIYDICITVLVVLPLIGTPILAAFRFTLLAVLLLVVCWVALAITAIIRKKYVLNNFYKIKDAHTKCNLINVTDVCVIQELHSNSALTFTAQPTNEMLNFVVNWLNCQKLLKAKLLDVYVFNGEMLKKALPKSKLNKNLVFFSISLDDLELNESNKYDFSKNHLLVGARWLDNIVPKK